MQPSAKKELSLFDVMCIIVGIIIGAGIYETTPVVAACMGSGPRTLFIWLAGGLLALTGALCYAELATTYPRSGGDYVYLTRAYGRTMGFLFGWTQLVIVRPGDIALISFVFARYAEILYAPFEHVRLVYAALAVILLTAINILGVKQGKWTQNILTVIKSLGLMAIVAAALFAPERTSTPAPVAPGELNLNLAVILVLFTYGGWNEIAYVAAEVKRPERNILRGLVIGTVAVTVLYLLANWAFLHTLGYEGMTGSEAVAVDSLATVFPEAAARVVGAIVCISALGAVNGLIFTGSRITYALGTEHRVFRHVGLWNKRSGTPIRALALQGCISLAIIVLAGSFIDTIVYTAPIFWSFVLATGLSLFVLRRKDPDTARPCKVALYPVVPIIFCAVCTFMCYSAFSYAYAVKPIALLILAVLVLAGLFTYLFSKGGHTDNKA